MNVRATPHPALASSRPIIVSLYIIFIPSRAVTLSCGCPIVKQGVREMLINVDLTSMECHFENCRYYENGMCLDKESREYCIEIALATLCADKTKEEQNGDKC